jgi:hypothetical protein
LPFERFAELRQDVGALKQWAEDVRPACPDEAERFIKAADMTVKHIRKMETNLMRARDQGMTPALKAQMDGDGRWFDQLLRELDKRGKALLVAFVRKIY